MIVYYHGLRVVKRQEGIQYKKLIRNITKERVFIILTKYMLEESFCKERRPIV